MPEREVPLQMDMFTGELKDTRTRKQKRAASKAEGYQQGELFSQQEIAQFGVRPHPRMSITPTTRMELTSEDPRTEEQREADLRYEIESKTYPMFRERPELYVVSGPEPAPGAPTGEAG